MKINRPLINPTPKEIEDEYQHMPSRTSTPIQQAPLRSREQLTLRVDNRELRLKQMFGSYKQKLKKRLDVLEVSPFWKNPGVSFMAVSYFFNILLLFIGGIFAFNNLPPNIQLFYDPIQKTWFRDQDKSLILLMPVFLACFFFIQFRLVNFIFRNDKRLGVTIAWIATYLNIVLLVAISQIYRLNT